MAEFSSDERIALRKLIDIYPQLLDLVDPCRPQLPQPAPVPKLVEAVNSLIELVPQIKCVNIYDVEQFGIRVNAVKDALTAECKRQELVESVLEIADKINAYYAVNKGIADRDAVTLAERLRNLDAFDKERGA